MATRKLVNLGGNLRPIAAPVGGATTLRVAQAVDPGLSVVAAFGGLIEPVTKVVQKVQAEEQELNTTAAEKFANSPAGLEIVQKLMDASGDITRQRKIMEKAASAGLYPRSLDPYVLVAVSRGEAMRAAEGLRSDLNTAIKVNKETTEKFNDATQQMEPGKSFDQVFAETVEKYKNNRFLRTEVGNTVWNGQLAQVRQQFTQMAIDENNAASVTRQKVAFRDSLGGTLNQMAVLSNTEQQSALIQEELSELLKNQGASGQIPNWKQHAGKMILDWAKTFGDSDPTGVAQVLDTLSAFDLGGQGELGDGARQPVFASYLQQARNELRENNGITTVLRNQQAFTDSFAQEFVWTQASDFDTQAALTAAMEEEGSKNPLFLSGRARRMVQQEYTLAITSGSNVAGDNFLARAQEISSAVSPDEFADAATNLFADKSLSGDQRRALLKDLQVNRRLMEDAPTTGAVATMKTNGKGLRDQVTRLFNNGEIDSDDFTRATEIIDRVLRLAPTAVLSTDGQINQQVVDRAQVEMTTAFQEATRASSERRREYETFLEENPTLRETAKIAQADGIGLNRESAQNLIAASGRRSREIQLRVNELDRFRVRQLNAIDFGQDTTGKAAEANRELNGVFAEVSLAAQQPGANVPELLLDAEKRMLDIVTGAEIVNLDSEGIPLPDPNKNTWAAQLRGPELRSEVPAGMRDRIYGTVGSELDLKKRAEGINRIFTAFNTQINVTDPKNLERAIAAGLIDPPRRTPRLVRKEAVAALLIAHDNGYSFTGLLSTERRVLTTEQRDEFRKGLPADPVAFVAAAGGFTLKEWKSGTYQFDTLTAGVDPETYGMSTVDTSGIHSFNNRRIVGSTRGTIDRSEFNPLTVPIYFPDKEALKKELETNKKFWLDWGREADAFQKNEKEFMKKLLEYHTARIEALQ